MTEATKLIVTGVAGLIVGSGFSALDCIGADTDKAYLCSKHCTVADDGGVAPMPDAALPVEIDAAIVWDAALPPDASSVEPPTVPPTTGTYPCDPGQGTDYVVGHENEGTPYTLDTVPWTGLRPGDSVRIKWSATPYKRRILVSTKGTAELPITLCGIPGPDGQLPVLDGDGSTPARLGGWRQVSAGYEPHWNFGMVTLLANRSQAYDDRPEWIIVQGLEIRNADPGTGGWTQGAAGVHINQGGKHIIVRGNVIHGCDQGVFASSADSNPKQLNEYLLVERNEIYDNGSPSEPRSHQLYLQGVGTRVIGNHIHSPPPGSLGTGIKDRSPGTIIEANWVESEVIVIDLVEPQEHSNQVITHPLFHKAWVRGNVLVFSQSESRVIHFGGDMGPPDRRGPLYVYNNSVLIKPPGGWNSTFIDIDAEDGVAYAHNNVVWRENTGAGIGITLLDDQGTLHLGVNAIGPRWTEKKQFHWPSRAVGMDNIITLTSPGWDPVTLEARKPGPLANAAGGYPPRISPLMLQYTRHRKVEPREKVTTLGAFE